MSDLSAKVIADLKRELAEAKAEANRVTESMGSEIVRLHGEITSLRGIISTWLEWGGHCQGCEFIRQRENNPALDTSLFADYCDCGWHLARKAVEVVK